MSSLRLRKDELKRVSSPSKRLLKKTSTRYGSLLMSSLRLKRRLKKG
jgi:hypothetical protein